ncbi:DoxX family protein [Stenotrophomonas maltophilia]|mgnify:CR=1 FL=1|jgi:putative oxidoreductase|uniref:DoxX family protein n=2 Tax=Stenotrophomonas maltophilia TaxID=40324 RepID=A0AAP7KZG2_STEMA|nr:MULTISPECIES: DoxX family protein [Stenotrophomonas]MBA0220318.1 DoxX family protein [Stenotrophomonas maltophilia]MBE5269575.1 DoxX family protein [Stenotrophomonas sp. B2]MBH1834568.1 DoxX family protein [Stenotrophomonas maltophilia]MCO7397946.1 DoxX family protein [Stenotrophomonas maltophilia]MCO7410139.1 DoxX family protein [Stenotrophomonas maltophilia]
MDPGLDLALLILRVAAGGFLLPHALGKLFGWFGGPGLSGFAAELRGFGLPSAAPLPLLLAGLQVLSGMAVLLGWQTRIAALAAAAFIGFTVLLAVPKGWFWMRAGAEYPLMWTLVLLAIALAGPGAWALDSPVFPGDIA